MADALLQIDGLTKRFGGVRRLRRHRARRADGRAARHHRPERRRQDHADRPARRRDRAELPAASLSTAATSPRCRSIAAACSGWRARSRSPRCFRDFTALDNVALAVQAHAGHSFRFWRDARERSRAARAGARGARARRPAAIAPTRCVASMSHGEHRQLEIAMALATKPRMLLLDEPMAGHGRGGIGAHGRDAARAQARADHPADRARHGGGVRARRPHHRAGLWPRHRLGRAGGDPRQCRRCGRPISASRRRSHG